ncbi:MAG: bifunctional serine/threonine-protein kinase/formylglycine-generating enzyme family protein [Nostoc sp.]|uniref:bifunctional serine/threonine-protein kinase/formylglycine-generating enzyme family protein n=1 Tax=Nostoc sp. TaxID=1180 RepID=UPI002FF986D5
MPTTGTVLRNRYKIVKILGSGGFGDTYLAVDLDLPNQPQCVVKHLKPNSNPAILQIVRRLFDSEAQVLYRLGNDSDQIPRLFAHFEEQGEFYLVQEFVDGEDLSYEIIPGQKLTEIAVTKLLKEILEILAVVHKKNIIHRDIKPQNLMRRRQDGKIVLIDFGAVKEVNTVMVNLQGQTSVSVTIGTFGYMPSEQAAGQPKLSSDVYAVGMLGIQALTGLQPHQVPKDPTDGEVIWRNWANVSDKLALVLNKMVNYHFRDRYPSAVEALEALKPSAPQQRQSSTPEIKQKPKDFIENLGNGVTLEMVQIPGGTFMMGSPEGEAERRDHESPQHQVRVPKFFMGKYAVTQAQYQAIMGGNIFQKIIGNNNPSSFKGEKRPVEGVSWDEAVEFCKKLSQKAGKTYRLPSEAEWEYACRAGTTTPFYFGETITTDLANYDGKKYPYGSAPKGEYREQTIDVGKFPPNSFGLYDMHGNVWELCLDVYNDNYQDAPKDGSAWLTGKDNSRTLARGGSWNFNARYCRSANRAWSADPGSNTGFRVVAVAVA